MDFEMDDIDDIVMEDITATKQTANGRRKETEAERLKREEEKKRLIAELVKKNRPVCDTPFIDYWVPEPNQKFVEVKDSTIIMHFNKIFNINKPSLDVFILSKKRAYIKIAPEISHYMNYFIVYYDTHKELIPHLFAIKGACDLKNMVYTEKMFLHDISLLFTQNILDNIDRLVDDNYIFDVTKPWTKSSNQLLRFDNYHAKLLYRISMGFKFVIPVMAHYIYARQVTDISRFITCVLENVFDILCPHDGPVNMYDKLLYSVNSNIDQTKHSDKTNWSDQEIRAYDSENFADRLMNVIITNTIPKYVFNDNNIIFNNIVMRDQVKYFLDEAYDYNLNAMNPNTRDDDGLSDFDKFEIQIVSEDESIIIMNTINVKQVLAQIAASHQPISQDEIDFYEKNIHLQKFQRNLIFQYFAKRFGGTTYLFNMNYDEQIKLIVYIKRELEAQGFIIIQHILTGRTTKVNSRRIKKHYIDAQQHLSGNYPDIVFNNGIIDKEILSAILTSQFELVDYGLRDKLGYAIDINTHKNIIVTEVIRFISLF